MKEEFEYIRANASDSYYGSYYMSDKVLYRTGCVKIVEDGSYRIKYTQVAVHRRMWFWKYVKYIWVQEKDIVKYKSEVTCTQVN